MLIDTFGGKGVVMYGGEPMFAEMALRHMCVDAGWQARWLSTYGGSKMRPKLYAEWDPRLHRRDQKSGWFEEGSSVLARLDVIARERGKYAGCPDVIAWSDDEILFIESKRRGKDAIRQTQKDWLAAALSLGVALDRYLLAEWTFAAD